MNWPLLQNSLLVAGITTALAVGFGLVAALWLATLAARGRNVFLALAIVALALPPFLVTNCWISLLGEAGTLRAWLPFKIYSLGGTIWILALLLWPITLFAMLAAWQRLEAEQFEGEPAMTGWALLRWLLIPVAKGELALAAVLTFVLALNNFAVPAILQTKVLPDELWIQFNTTFFLKQEGGFDFGRLVRVTWPLVVVPALGLGWLARRGVSWPRVQGPVSARVFGGQLGAAGRIGAGSLAVALGGLSVVVPLAQIVAAKRTWVELAGAIAASRATIWNSLWLATLAAALVVGAALALILGSSRGHEARPGRTSLLTSAATLASWLAFFLPGVLIGIALIKIFNRPMLVAVYQSLGIVLLAFAIRYFGLAWTATRHAVASVDTDLTEAARLEGATRWQIFRFVVWPQIAPQIFAAWYVVYLLCLWDVESIVIIQPPGGETLALKIFNLLHYGRAAQVNALCLALLGLAVLPLIVAAVFVRTRHLFARVGPENCSRLLTNAATIGLLVVVAGCGQGQPKNEAHLNSHFFERAQVIGARGVGLGEFNKPRSLAVDWQDNVYAADMTGRIQKFSPEGKFLLAWQMPQTDLGKPKGMGRDHEGNILVIEPHYQRVNHFTTAGRLVAQWGCRGTNEGCFTLPRGLVENSRNEFLVSEYMGAERVQRFKLRGSNPGTNRENPHLTPMATGFHAGGTSTNWPYVKTDVPLASAASNSVAPRLAAEVRQVLGQAGTGPGEFNRPEGICVDGQDRLYVADSCNHRIQIFSADGKFVRQYGRAGSGLGELSYPYDIAVDAQGNQFVCEFGNSRIQVFDANCQPVEIIGGPGAEPGKFANPWGVALDARGNLFVADALNHRLQKLVRRMGAIAHTRPSRAVPDDSSSRVTPHASASDALRHDQSR